MTRITVEVTLTNEYSYTDYYGTERNIYTMRDDEGTTYVWKTTCLLKIGEIESDDCYIIKTGDRFTIKATVKDHSEYKGHPQTVLTRVKVINVLGKALTHEEKIELKKREQMDSLKGDDFIWTMPYKQYKEHYADCETLAGSFIRPDYDVPQITVIIREGRLKNSGVRGKHFRSYFFTNEEGKKSVYYAVSEENAYKRCVKENPDHEWECTKII